MDRNIIQRLKEKVSCELVLEQHGYCIDKKESTRNAVKFRLDSEIVIVTHGGQGWFDPLSDAKGDVFTLVGHLDHIGFVDAANRVAQMVGIQPTEQEWRSRRPVRASETNISETWVERRRPWPGSATWRYLRAERMLPANMLRAAISQDLLREGPYGSMWAAHTDDAGIVCGWEARGPEWRGFATGGSKVLFRLGPEEADRVCVTEAAIDAMSLAAIEGARDETLYVSTGGGWSPRTDAALRVLAERKSVRLIAATDANVQGDSYADRLRAIADELHCGWQRLRPSAEDWNAVLKGRWTT